MVELPALTKHCELPSDGIWCMRNEDAYMTRGVGSGSLLPCSGWGDGRFEVRIGDQVERVIGPAPAVNVLDYG